MQEKIQSIRGMNDILPADISAWQWVEKQLRQLMDNFNYQEIRFPIVESTNLFKRSIGEVTDIVEKEMYSFDDRNGDSLTLRPEGTAVCVRAGVQNGLLANQQQRLWYTGPMFRHERPQKGRYRQFHQFGVEAFGIASADIDAELIMMTAQLWKRLGMADDVKLLLNSLGSNEARQNYRDVLVDYFTQHIDQLDEDSKRRLSSNPLRILDSKNPDMLALNEAAPKLHDYLDDESAAHFKQLCALLDAAGITYEISPRLVRGLDYYNRTVFEWVTDKLGAQGTVCAGGRYDGLVEQLGGKSTPAVGFAMGMERLISLLDEQTLADSVRYPHAVFVSFGDSALSQSMNLAQQLREQLPEVRLLTLCGGGSFKSQMKKADKSGAALAFIIGDDELAQQCVSVKYLRDSDKQQESVAMADLPGLLANV